MNYKCIYGNIYKYSRGLTKHNKVCGYQINMNEVDFNS